MRARRAVGGKPRLAPNYGVETNPVLGARGARLEASRGKLRKLEHFVGGQVGWRRQLQLYLFSI
jgi:hypothetical protein